MVPRLMAAAARRRAGERGWAIHLGGFGQGGGVFFQLDGALEHLLHVGLTTCQRPAAPTMLSWRWGTASKSKASCCEVIDDGAAVAECEARSATDGGGLDERIAHARGLTHGLDGLANAFRGDARGSQSAQLQAIGRGLRRNRTRWRGSVPPAPTRLVGGPAGEEFEVRLDGCIGSRVGLDKNRTMLLMRVCGAGGRPARGFTVSSSKTRGYPVPNMVPKRFCGVWTGILGELGADDEGSGCGELRSRASVWLV